MDELLSMRYATKEYVQARIAEAMHYASGGGGGATLGPKSITANGVYNASSDGLDGYDQVTVNVATGAAKATGEFTILSTYDGNCPTITHNLGTKKIAAIIYPVSVQATEGYSHFYAMYLNVPEIVDAGVWLLDFTSYNNNFATTVSVDPKVSADAEHLRTIARQESPWTSQSTWYAADHSSTENSGVVVTENTVRFYPLLRFSPGSYKYTIFALD